MSAINTQLVHAGERQTPPVGLPSAMPIYATSTFSYGSMAEVDNVFAGDAPDFVYTRYGNPTVAALETALAQLENGAAAVAFASGMAAMHAALLACELNNNSIILASADLYGATLDLLYKIFAPFGVRIATADFNDLDDLRAKTVELKPRVLIAETISNPLLKVCDIEKCGRIAREANAKFIVDNTFASPFLCRPLDVGADFAVHSATKFLGGHADAMGGIVAAREQIDYPALLGAVKLAGGVLSVWEAHQILRGVKTLGLRLERQCDNARLLAEFFTGHPSIEAVYYPLTNERELTNRVLRPPFGGALVSIRLKDDTKAAAYQFLDNLKLCVRATSLGDVFTGATHPVTASHRELSPKRRRALGITDGLIRFSLGIEDIADIIADVEQAF